MEVERFKHRHALYVDLAMRCDYSSPAARALHRPRRALRLLVPSHTHSTSTSPCAVTTSLQPHALYVDLAVRGDYSSPAARALRPPRRAPRLLVSGRTRSTSTSPCAATTRLRPHALYVNLVVHREYSSSLSRLQRSTSTPPRVRVPRHVARLVTRLVLDHSASRWLVVDYSASRRLIVDYFAYAARPGASARRAARHAARGTARRRLLRLTQALRRLPRLAQARRQLLHHASGCLGTSRDSSSTTSPPPHVRVPRHVARLVTWLVAPLVVDYSASRSLVVDYSVRRDFVLRPHWLYFSHAMRRDYLSLLRVPRTPSRRRLPVTSR
jgi:hypothetical protein